MTQHTPVNLPESWRRKHLTSAEQKVVELIVAGHSPKDVACTLDRSISTVRNQLYTAMKKLNLRNRYALIACVRPVATEVPAAETSAILEYAI